MKKSYKIDVDCANCALKMEDAAKDGGSFGCVCELYDIKDEGGIR